MGLFSIFSNKEVDAFANDLAADLAKRYPPAIDVSPDKRVSENRLTRVLEETLLKAAEFQQQHKLGVIGKAKLGNKFKWQLKEMGYTDKFIDVATEALMVYLTRGPQPQGASAGKR
ncbi:MAG TPA: hypothetical protein VML91_27910 [Burkholderiales bacterium]|nr:hypothetical protein [Burkholderiales bacterium]